jgi:hypothetical protein
MDRIRRIILCLSIILIGSSAFAQSFEWHEYRSPTDSFEVVFPGVPKTETFKYNTPSNAQTRWSTVTLLHRTFVVAVTDYRDLETIEKLQGLTAMYDTLRDNGLKPGDKIVSEKMISCSGYQGRESVVENSGSFLKERRYLLNKRLYQVFVSVDSAAVDDKQLATDIDRFLNSFRFVGL